MIVGRTLITALDPVHSFTMIQLTIQNPKPRYSEKSTSSWYRYYPCFSEDFAEALLSSAGLGNQHWVLDPWNGSGTTTAKATLLGLNTYGYDLNPVMVLIAKARGLDPAEYSSLRPLLADIHRKATRPFEINPSDPLLTWLVPRSVSDFRGIEAVIQKLLVDDQHYLDLNTRGVCEISDLAAFFYVALFRALKQLLEPFLTSNPTWVKRPRHAQSRLRPHRETIKATFTAEARKMLPLPIRDSVATVRGRRVLGVASSDRLPLGNATVDLVLSSPPYCTRIDYAVATSIELAALGQQPNSDFDALRRQLIGNTTVPKVAADPSEDFGPTCLNFLRRLSAHKAKASSTYYYKNHLQYFHAISRSLSEIGRVLKPNGRCVLVVQDSYYKDLHTDLPNIMVEMAQRSRLELGDRFDFPLSRTMAGINPRTSEYRSSFTALESVLVLNRSDDITNTINQLHF